MSLGEDLKTARMKKGITQEQVGAQLYVTRQTISRWEQNKTMPNIYVLQELSMIYGKTLDELISGEVVKEKVEKKKKINIFALLGFAIFNFLVIASATVPFAVMFCVFWILTIGLIFAPVILFILYFFNVQIVTIRLVLLCVFYTCIGLFLLKILYRVTIILFRVLKSYIRFNIKNIYY